jgi:hypothetical protein
LARAHQNTRLGELSVAHPRFVELLGRSISVEQLESLSLRHVLPRLPRMVLQALRRRLRRQATPSNGREQS